MGVLVLHPMIVYGVKTRWVPMEDEKLCWGWVGNTNERGYGYFGVHIDGRRFKCYAHRVSYMYFNNLSRLEEDDCILHDCDNPPCTNPKHLFFGDRGINLADMTAKGRRAYGTDLNNSPLSLADVEEIKRLRRDKGWTYQRIGDHFGVSLTTAWNIVNRITRTFDK